jgi:hypothetical protein
MLPGPANAAVPMTNLGRGDYVRNGEKVNEVDSETTFAADCACSDRVPQDLPLTTYQQDDEQKLFIS